MSDARREPPTPAITIPMDRDRIIARAIVEEMLPRIREEMRPMVHEEVANAMLSTVQRIVDLEVWRKRVETEQISRADVTGTHSIEELRRGEQEAAARVQRKLQRLEMESVAARAIEKAESRGFSGWMQRHGWKAAIAAILIAFQVLSRWVERVFLK